MLRKYKFPVWLFFAALLITLSIYFYFYWKKSTLYLSEAVIESKIENVLNRAVEEFDSLSHDLESRSLEIEQSVVQAHNSQSSQLALYQRLPDDHFWGISILKNGQKWVWKDFNVSPPLSFGETSAGTTVTTRNSSILLQRISHLTLDEDQYIISTAFLLSKTSDLPFDNENNNGFTEQFTKGRQFPVSFDFFGFSPDQNQTEYRYLQTAAGDSIGVVYADRSDSVQYKEALLSRLTKNISFLEMTSSVLVLITLFFIAFYSRNKVIYWIYLFAVTLGWILIFRYSLYSAWVREISFISYFPSKEMSRYLVTYGIHALFLLFSFLGIHNLLLLSRKKLLEEQYLRTFASSILFSVIAAVVVVFTISITNDTLSNGGISIIELELAPGISSFIFFLEALIFLGSAVGLILTTGYYLQFREREKTVIIVLLSIFGFIITLYFINRFVEFQIFEKFSIVSASILFFSTLIILYLIEKYPMHFMEMSGFRRLMLLVLIVSSSLYGLVWKNYNAKLNDDLLRHATLYIDGEEQKPQQMLSNLLTNMEQSLSILKSEDIETRRQPVANLFQRSVQNHIQNLEPYYSFNVRLIDTYNNEITSYSTSIDSPVMTNFFSTALMQERYFGERIRFQTNRPVIWGRPANSADHYVSFERGWIPIYDQDNPIHIIAWIVGDIFKERLDYNKPVRAIMSNVEENWKKSFYINEFQESRLTNTSLFGLYRNQPHYLRLPASEAEIATRDSINFYTNITREHAYRELLMRAGEGRLVKASTPLPGLNLHMFSFFKMQIVMIFFGLFCSSVLASMGFYRMSLFGQNRKFSTRLVDGLVLSTILLLTVLIFATRYTLTEQNQRNIERDLLNNLNGITESVMKRSGFLYNRVEANALSDIASPLNVDLILYRNSDVEVSSTPQIFQQHILSSLMPFIVYDNLFNRERATMFVNEVINDEVLLVGFQSILNADGTPVGAVAIPTFFESPIFVEQLLEATSYLFVLYLVMFTLFIAGTVVISSRLTRPLTNIQKGLRKISRGDTRTKIPVTSRDEIGSLANAYNQMVERLVEARKELVKAERESAWKEMAQQVAHEIKNPLTPMKLNLQHLQRQLDQNPDDIARLKPMIEKTADNIIRQIDSLSKIASDFSKFAKPISSSKQDIHLEELLKSVIQLYEHSDELVINLNLNNSGKVTIHAAEDELQRVFINVIKNAHEAAIDLPARLDIEAKVNKHTQQAHITIRDYGIGISEVDKERIFRPQFSTKSSGTGLGLAISKKITEAHGGTITVDSEPEKGAIFTISLPCSQP